MGSAFLRLTGRCVAIKANAPKWTRSKEGNDPRGFVRSLNSDRRDLTASQRAVIALKEIEAKRAKERMLAGKRDPTRKTGEGDNIAF
jgi:hypothetical protein